MTLLVTHIKYSGSMLLATLAILLLVVGPTYRKSNVLQSNLARLTERVNEGPTDLAILKATEERVARLRDQLQGGTREIPDASDVAGIVSAISSDIASLGLEDARLNRGKETSLGGTASIGLNVETTGRFDVVVRLLERIEGLSRLVRISTFLVEPVDHKEGLVKATIGLDAYYRVNAGPVTSTATVPDDQK
jgi:Tfp pilus assembly protein PilO